MVMITTRGMMQRIAIKDLRTIGRATQGVRVIRLGEGDRLQAIACVAPEADGDEAPEDTPGGDEAAAQ
jgi:DNA gyrase subunit A